MYDDNWQIVQNHLIQENSLILKALSSDVWAFRGDSERVVSNYWRPGFVLYLILNQRLFGLADTTGWHVTNILLHTLTVVIAYGFLRFLKLTAWVAGAISLVFAVHPAHVESVAWISGSPDLILAPAFLGALWLLLSAFPPTEQPAGKSHRKTKQPAEKSRSPIRWRLLVAGILAALAMSAKEIGLLFPLVATTAVLRCSVSPSVAHRAPGRRPPAHLGLLRHCSGLLHPPSASPGRHCPLAAEPVPGRNVPDCALNRPLRLAPGPATLHHRA